MTSIFEQIRTVTTAAKMGILEPFNFSGAYDAADDTPRAQMNFSRLALDKVDLG